MRGKKGCIKYITKDEPYGIIDEGAVALKGESLNLAISMEISDVNATHEIELVDFEILQNAPMITQPHN